MTRFVFVRHGETAWHAENRYAGSSDIGLTEHGRRQADELAGWAAGAALTGIWTSDLVRARETGAPAARASGLTARADTRLREVDFGDGEGLTRSEMATRFPAGLAAFLATPASSPLPRGERGIAAAERFIAVLDEICVEEPAGRILIVAHSTVTRISLCTVLGIDPDRYRQVFPSLGNGLLTEIDYARTPPAALLALNARP